jgi:hypothetical protein
MLNKKFLFIQTQARNKILKTISLFCGEAKVHTPSLLKPTGVFTKLKIRQQLELLFHTSHWVFQALFGGFCCYSSRCGFEHLHTAQNLHRRDSGKHNRISKTSITV